MPDVLIREIDPRVLDALKARARSNSRSLNAELQTILTEVAKRGQYDARKAATKIRHELKGGEHTDSAILLREDRNR